MTADDNMATRLRTLAARRDRQADALGRTVSTLATVLTVAVNDLGWTAERAGRLTGFTARQVRDQLRSA